MSSASSGAVAGGLLSACMAVRPPGPGICRICCGAILGHYEECWSCRQIEERLGQPLTPITPISLAVDGTPVYTALKQYKGHHEPTARRQQLRLAGLIGIFLRHHTRCIAVEGFDAVAAVPSLQGRDGLHPLVTTLGLIGSLRPAIINALSPGTGRVARNSPSMDAYLTRHDLVVDRRILLVDDTYTTGAHLHSAAASLISAGAREIYPLVVGRRQNRAWPPSQHLAEWSALGENRWSSTRCIHCWSRDPAMS